MNTNDAKAGTRKEDCPYGCAKPGRYCEENDCLSCESEVKKAGARRRVIIRCGITGKTYEYEK